MNKYIKQIRYKRWIFLESNRLKNKISHLPKSIPLKIILGAGPSCYEGWISSDLPYFDITKKEHWEKYFTKRKIDNLLAEHVIEHLDELQVKEVLLFAFQYLQKGGIFRIAVPDAFHPNPEYIEAVKPNGNGQGADDHKTFWNYNSLPQLAISSGFESANILEYADENKIIHCSDFDNSNGVIQRSKSKNHKSPILDYSSLIVDIIK